MDFLRREADIERRLKLRTARAVQPSVQRSVIRPLFEDGCVAKLMEGTMLFRIIRGKLKPGTGVRP